MGSILSTNVHTKTNDDDHAKVATVTVQVYEKRSHKLFYVSRIMRELAFDAVPLTMTWKSELKVMHLQFAQNFRRTTDITDPTSKEVLSDKHYYTYVIAYCRATQRVHLTMAIRTGDAEVKHKFLLGCIPDCEVDALEVVAAGVFIFRDGVVYTDNSSGTFHVDNDNLPAVAKVFNTVFPDTLVKCIPYDDIEQRNAVFGKDHPDALITASKRRRIK